MDPIRGTVLKEREDAVFVRKRPRSQALWASGQSVMPNGVPMSWLRTSYDHPPLFIQTAAGSRLRDVDCHEFADFNIADMSMFTGYGPAPVVEAVRRQVARGSQYLLPTEDSIWVAGELARRNPVSMAAARAIMSEVLTDEAYAHSQRLGARLADGLSQVVAAATDEDVEAYLAAFADLIGELA